MRAQALRQRRPDALPPALRQHEQAEMRRKEVGMFAVMQHLSARQKRLYLAVFFQFGDVFVQIPARKQLTVARTKDAADELFAVRGDKTVLRLAVEVIITLHFTQKKPSLLRADAMRAAALADSADFFPVFLCIWAYRKLHIVPPSF